MARTRAVPRRRPNINFDNWRLAAAKEMAHRVRASDAKIKFLLPQGKDVEVKVRGNVVRKMHVRRIAKHGAKKRNVRYGIWRMFVQTVQTTDPSKTP